MAKLTKTEMNGLAELTSSDGGLSDASFVSDCVSQDSSMKVLADLTSISNGRTTNWFTIYRGKSYGTQLFFQ